ncbi:hypothetical protein [Tropicimonas sp. S265A]|uniref:hypothetical protein n=1 Tax=Tropicimonas sp. S265A TaxID=3415134 RepID=UPI003C7B7DD2
MSDISNSTGGVSPLVFPAQAGGPDLRQRARDRRKAALEVLAQRRARGETEMIVRARRRHERLKRDLLNAR